MKWTAMPSLSALRAFDAVAREGGFAAAATTLNVTEAAMRQHIRALERDLGRSLVERRGRGIALTDAGRMLADATRGGFEALFAGVEALTDDDADRPVRVALPPSFAEMWLMPRLGDFWRVNPDIAVELAPGLRLADLRGGRFDLAIRYGLGDWPGCRSVLLASADYLIVARADLGAKHEGITRTDLAALPWLFEAGRDEHRTWAAAHGVDFDGPRVKRFPTNALVLSAVRAGQGVSLQARALVERELDSGVLTALYAEPSDPLGYYVVTQDEPRPLARRFIAWLLDSA